MKSSPHIQDRTRMCARVLGPYLLLASLSLVARPDYVDSLLKAFSDSPAWPWLAGAFVLPMGLVVIALHPYWRGPAAFTVSVLGWLTAFKGLALMTFPQSYLLMGQGMVGASPWWQGSVAVMGLLGLYLTLVGWATAWRRPAVRHAAGHETRDLHPATNVPRQ